MATPTTDAPQKPKVYLDEDPVRVPGFNYVLLSFVSPESNVKCEKIGLKVRGAFDNLEAAQAHAKRLMEVDPNFDVFVADAHRWLLVPPKPSEIANEEYVDEYLNTLLKTHKEEQLKAKAAFEAYKKEQMALGNGEASSSGTGSVSNAPADSADDAAAAPSPPVGASLEDVLEDGDVWGKRHE